MIEIPGYTIIRELGYGGMATVYLARQDRLGREVALKVMNPSVMTEDDFTARFMKEGRIIARLQHPQIVTIYDLNITDGLHYFSMEYLPNGTLSDQIEAGLSAEKAIDITKRIAEALTVAHKHKVIHRDIKPQNILFRADGTPVLTDFGIARAAGAGAGGETTQMTRVGMVIGSPPYMSPEQSMSQSIDSRSDLYSLGIVFYKMLTRELPYQAEDPFDLVIKHRSAPIPVLPGPLQTLQPIVEKLLAKSPEDRFADTRELIRALDDFQQAPNGSPSVESDGTLFVDPSNQILPSPPLEPRAPGGNLVKRAILVLTLAGVIAAGLFILVPQWMRDSVEDLAVALDLPPPRADRPAASAHFEKVALEHLQNEELAKSLELVRSGLQTDPGDSRLKALESRVIDRMQAVKLLREAERRLVEGYFSDSLALIEQGLELAPGYPGLIDLREEVVQEREKHKVTQALELLHQAQAAYDRGDFVESMQITADARLLAPGDTRLEALETRLQNHLNQQRVQRDAVSRSLALIDEGRHREALKEVENALETAPAGQELLKLKARIAEAIEQAAEKEAGEIQGAAEYLLEEGKLADGLIQVERGLELAPGHEGLTGLRDRILNERTSDRAARAARRLADAQTAFDRNELATSLKLCKEGLVFDPGSAELKVLKARVEQRIDQPKNLAAVVAQVSSLVDQRQFSEALGLIRKALTRIPENGMLLDLKQTIEEQVEQVAVEEAAELAKEAEELAQQGKLDRALNLFDQALELRPSDPDLRDRQAAVAEQVAASRVDLFLGRARLAFAAGKLDQALDLVKKGLGERPEHFELLELQTAIRSQAAEEKAVTEAVGKARASLDDGHFAAGLQILERALVPYPNNPELLELRSQIKAAKERSVAAKLLPEMVAIEGGCFRMGSPESEPNRAPDEQSHRVCVEDFELAKYETPIADFKRFVTAEGFETDAERGIGGAVGCLALDPTAETDNWGYHAWANWRVPRKNRRIDPYEPVTCVSKNDAQAYIDWLNRATGQLLRLPTEAEWEYAARATNETARFWGDSTDQTACRNANTADTGHDWDAGFPCDDGYEWAAPTGSYAPNPWGLYDMLGNSLEWTCSEYAPTYAGAETICASATSRSPIVLRGGAWNSGPADVRAAWRDRNYPESRTSFVGFRVARDAPRRKR